MERGMMSVFCTKEVKKLGSFTRLKFPKLTSNHAIKFGMCVYVFDAFLRMTDRLMDISREIMRCTVLEWLIGAPLFLDSLVLNRTPTQTWRPLFLSERF
jgi:hypothetical protein